MLNPSQPKALVRPPLDQKVRRLAPIIYWLRSGNSFQTTQLHNSHQHACRESLAKHQHHRSVLLFICLLARHTARELEKAHRPASHPTGAPHTTYYMFQAPRTQHIMCTRGTAGDDRWPKFSDEGVQVLSNQLKSNQRVVILGALKSTLKSTQINAERV